jgi:hypothetical protein
MAQQRRQRPLAGGRRRRVNVKKTVQRPWKRFGDHDKAYPLLLARVSEQKAELSAIMTNIG